MIGNLALFFIILNSIIGGGLFINLSLFSQQAGTLGIFLYPLGFCFFSPIIFCLGTLAQTIQSEGGLFYIIKKQLGEKFAFVAVWCYFLGRTVSVAVLLTALCRFLQTDFSFLRGLNELTLITLLAVFICSINVLGVSNTGHMQKVFILFKLTPIFLLTILGSLFFDKSNLMGPVDANHFFQNLNVFLPPAIYALQGSSIAIHIGHRIKNPQDIRKILMFATFAAALLCTLFQFIVFCKVGTTTGNLLINFINSVHITNPFIMKLFVNLVTVSVFSSSFMILTGNSWNLFTLAKNKFLPFSELLTITTNNTPALCLFLHAVSSLFFVFICQNIPALQAASVLSAFIMYLICSIAAVLFLYQNEKRFLWIGILALASVFWILKIALIQTISAGISIEFILFVALGVGLFLFKTLKIKD